MTKYSADRERYVRKVQDEISGYTTQLLSDIETLRIQTASLTVENQRLRDQVLHFQEERAAWEARERQLDRQLRQIEAQHSESARERIRMERRNAELTHLYVACHRIREGLDREEFFQALEEILGSIVGCEEYAVYECEGAAGVLRLATSVGLERPEAEAAVGACRIRTAAAEGAVWVAPDGVPGADDGLTACVPLIHRGRTLGVIALYRLLEHKPRIGEFEQEVFEILLQLGGGALYCASNSERGPDSATRES